jgi:hypothetical protein
MHVDIFMEDVRTAEMVVHYVRLENQLEVPIDEIASPANIIDNFQESIDFSNS